MHGLGEGTEYSRKMRGNELDGLIPIACQSNTILGMPLGKMQKMGGLGYGMSLRKMGVDVTLQCLKEVGGCRRVQRDTKKAWHRSTLIKIHLKISPPRALPPFSPSARL